MARTALGKIEEALQLARDASKIAKLDEAAARALKEVARTLLRRGIKQFKRKVARRRNT